MKNKILILLIFLMSITNSAFSFSLNIPKELKAGAVMFGKISVGVVISIFIIWGGLILYKNFLERKGMPQAKPQKNNEVSNNTDNQTKPSKKATQNQIDKCEIDDAKTMEEAINTFLTIDNRH